MKVIVTNAEMTPEEQQSYVRYVLEKYPRFAIEKLILTVENDMVHMSIIPRKSVLTKMGGTSIGDPLFWNDAKRAEFFDTIPNRLDG